MKFPKFFQDLLEQEKKENNQKREAPKTFPYLSIGELVETLGLTIKRDNENKLTTFLCMLSAFTEKSQFNISFNAPSSTGKSYIPIEIAKLFPEEDVIEVGYCSPTAFFHDPARLKKDKDQFIISLERKILIFLDQPHNLLLQHLRPILSQDKKEILVKITDRSKRKLRTKNTIVRGFPSVVFCSAGLNIDEQEATRFLLLSPEINQEKIREAVREVLKRESDYQAYRKELESNPKRAELKERIEAIKEAKIKDIRISEDLNKTIEERFFTKYKFLKPRHSRDAKRLTCLIKAFALLNFWQRKMTEDRIIICEEEDFENALKVWEVISESQELNLPPYLLQLYQTIVLPLWEERNRQPLTRKDVILKHLEVYGMSLPEQILRKQVIPMWENAGLIGQVEGEDKRIRLIEPLVF